MIVLTRRGAHPLFVGDFAALRPVEEPRSVGPILYFKGVSTGDFEEALITLLGKDAGGLSATTVGRLKEAWSQEHARWSKRDLSMSSGYNSHIRAGPKKPATQRAEPELPPNS